MFSSGIARNHDPENTVDRAKSDNEDYLNGLNGLQSSVLLQSGGSPGQISQGT